MGLPIATLKDPSKIFPIRPLSVYVLADENKYYWNIERFEFIVNRPPYSLLPIDYYFICRQSHVKQNNIFDELAKYSIITRDVETEEYFEKQSVSFPKEYCVVYMCGKVDWRLDFGLEMAINIITYNLLQNIKTIADKAVHFPDFSSYNEAKIVGVEWFDNILSTCDEALKVLSKKSRTDLKPRINEMREWLSKTTIIRSTHKELSDSIIQSSFEQGRILQSDYRIVLKRTSRKGRSDVYRLNFMIGDKPYKVDSKQQCVSLYFIAAVFKYKGMCFNRDFLIDGLSTESEIAIPEQRRALYVINACFGALRGYNTSVSFKTILDYSVDEDLQVYPGFGEFIKDFCYNDELFELQKLTNLVSRMNKIIIGQTLKDFPEEVKEIFYLRYDPKNQLYNINISKEDIIIEEEE